MQANDHLGFFQFLRWKALQWIHLTRIPKGNLVELEFQSQEHVHFLGVDVHRLFFRGAAVCTSGTKYKSVMYYVTTLSQGHQPAQVCILEVLQRSRCDLEWGGGGGWGETKAEKHRSAVTQGERRCVRGGGLGLDLSNGTQPHCLWKWGDGRSQTHSWRGRRNLRSVSIQKTGNRPWGRDPLWTLRSQHRAFQRHSFRTDGRANLECLGVKPEETKLPNYPCGKWRLLLQRGPGQDFLSQGAYGARSSLWRGNSVVPDRQEARRHSCKPEASSALLSLQPNGASPEGFPSETPAHYLPISQTPLGDTVKTFWILENSTAWNVDPNIHL